jgi:hypothetical protein
MEDGSGRVLGDGEENMIAHFGSAPQVANKSKSGGTCRRENSSSRLVNTTSAMC